MTEVIVDDVAIASNLGTIKWALSTALLAIRDEVSRAPQPQSTFWTCCNCARVPPTMASV